jgi:hypothetical protein
MEKEYPLIKDPDYVQGQIQALHALIVAIADRTMSKQDFRESALARLAAARTHLLWGESSDARLAAIDVEEKIVRTLTS